MGKSSCDHEELDDLTGTPPIPTLKPETRHFRCKNNDCRAEFFVARADNGDYYINTVYPQKRRKRTGENVNEIKRRLQRLEAGISRPELCA
jgi:hypothetical protein